MDEMKKKYGGIEVHIKSVESRKGFLQDSIAPSDKVETEDTPNMLSGEFIQIDFEVDGVYRVVTSDKSPERAYSLYYGLYGGNQISRGTILANIRCKVVDFFRDYLTKERGELFGGQPGILEMVTDNFIIEESSFEPRDLGYAINQEYTKLVGEVKLQGNGSLLYYVPSNRIQ